MRIRKQQRYQICEQLSSMGIPENSLTGKLSKFHIANANLFCILILGPGSVSTEPEEIRSVKIIRNLR